MTYYRSSLAELPQGQDIHRFGAQVGNLYLSCTFKWAVANQEQYDLITARIKQMAENDPLQSVHELNRTYDWVEFYLYFRDLTDAQIGDWVDTADVKPISFQGKERWQQIQMIYDNAALASDLQNLLNLYKEVMRWSITITDTDGNTTTGFIEPGGWYQNQDFVYSFRFISDRTYIGRDDLIYVTMEVRVNE